MTEQKHGFLVFIASLIPGAGEMYMGFRKQGVSIMLLFWGAIALGSMTGLDWLIFLIPVLWLYSFFNVHNLKSLSEEDFYSVEDTYILHLDQFIGSTDNAFKKHQTVVAALLIFFGASILWNNLTDILYWIMPRFFGNFLSTVFYQLPGSVVAVAIIAAGVYLLRNKKQQLDTEENSETPEEHYWAPYRPYRQSVDAEAETEPYTPPTEVPETQTAEAETAVSPEAEAETAVSLAAETETEIAASQEAPAASTLSSEISPADPEKAENSSNT